METFIYRDKTYDIDSQGYLIHQDQWDKDFAEGMCPQVDIKEGLTEKHWEIIQYIRDVFSRTGECPIVYQTCRANGLTVKEFKKLFPTGYMRGACKVAGITHKDRIAYIFGKEHPEIEPLVEAKKAQPKFSDKIYRVDVFGFLVDPNEWDYDFAQSKAQEMQIQGRLSESHCRIIEFLRDSYFKNQVVPTVTECCEQNGIDFEELAKLFPGGYHRCAIKISGLRVL